MATESDAKPRAIRLKNLPKNHAESETERARALKFVNDKVQGVENARTYLLNKWVMLERLWRGEPLSRFYPAEYTTHVPEPFKAVESLMPRIIEGVFPQKEWFRVVARSQVGSIEAIANLIRQQLADGNFDFGVEEYVRAGLIFGTAFAKCPWIEEEFRFYFNESTFKEEWKDGVLMGREPSKGKKEEFSEDRSRTELVPIPIYNFFCDPRYSNLRDMPWCADEFEKTKEYVLNQLDAKWFGGITKEELDKLSEKTSPSATTDSRTLRYRQTDLTDVKRDSKDDIVITDFWGLYELEEGKPRVECNITVLNRKHVVNIRQNKLWHQRRPYLHWAYTPVAGEIYGIGCIEPIVRLCQDLDDMRNTINQASAISANPMFVVADSADIEDEVIRAAPGKIIRASSASMDVLRPIVMSDQSALARSGEGFAKMDINETLGTTRVGYGGQDSSGSTATEVYTRSRESNVRTKSAIRRLGKFVLEPFLEICHYNNHQFMQEERMVLKTGDVGDYLSYKVTPDQLAGPASFEVLLAPQIELIGIRGQQMMAFMERVSANPVMMSQIPNPRELARAIWIDQFGDRDVNRIFPPAPEDQDISQDEETLLMAKGVNVDVRKYHNHAEHLRRIALYIMSPEFVSLTDKAQTYLLAHAQNHQLWMKRMQETLSMPPAQTQAMQPAMPGMMPGQAPAAALPPGSEGGAAGTAAALQEQARAGIQGT